MWRWERLPIGQPDKNLHLVFEYEDLDHAPAVTYSYYVVKTRWDPSKNICMQYTGEIFETWYNSREYAS
jgi:hypothetical protein